MQSHYLSRDGVPGDWLEILRGNDISNQFFAWTSWGGWASPRQIRQREIGLPITLTDRQLVQATAYHEETLARASLQQIASAHLTPVQQTLSSDYINNVLEGMENRWIQLAPHKRELYLESMRQFLINHEFDVVTKPKPAERPKHPYGRKF